MNRKLAVAALTGALLSGLLVGVSYGGSEGDTGTVIESGGSERGTGTAIELNWNTRREGGVIQYFAFDPKAQPCDDSDPICAQITLKELPLFDQDDTLVGRQHIQCTVADFVAPPSESVAWFCHYVTMLKDGPYTDRGRLTGVGVKRPSGDALVTITGGTGAYEDAGGYIFQSGDTGKVGFSIHLTS